jgi:3',5'-cyclic AMP phosphodiesterase CpdA
MVVSSDDTIKILQLTDQHLMYGFGYNDNQTFKLIKELSDRDDYDLIVLTGDQTMAPRTTAIYRRLIEEMEALKIPWTFVFGNHDNDHCSYEDLINVVNEADTTYLQFKVGPEMTDGGFGNFKIDFMYNNEIIYHAYFLDSKNEEDEFTEEEGEYGYISEAQVSWYETHVSQDTKESVVFMHIPLRQFIDADVNDENFTGIFNEDKVYAQGKDTGFYQAMVDGGMSKAVFVGHDHLNDFSIMLDGILLAYGRNSGYSAYGNLDRGGRHIEISNDNDLTTYIVLGDE